MKYIILANYTNKNLFNKPKQLIEINGEPIICRTIRLLKENGVKDILISSNSKLFDNLGVERYNPINNHYDGTKESGYWLDAFPVEILNKPTCYLFGDVYYTENAIKKIIETKVKENTFFCQFENKCEKYKKEWDEPLAYKVVDLDLFKESINKVKLQRDNYWREPIVWELYRVMNNQDIGTHIMTKNYIAINDESCDVDFENEVEELKKTLGGEKMIKCEVIKEFTLERFDELKNIKRKSIGTNGKLYVGDIFECDKEMADYLMGNNNNSVVVVKVIEIEPEIKILSQSPVEQLEKTTNIESEITTATYKQPKKKKNKKK